MSKMTIDAVIISPADVRGKTVKRLLEGNVGRPFLSNELRREGKELSDRLLSNKCVTIEELYSYIGKTTNRYFDRKLELARLICPQNHWIITPEGLTSPEECLTKEKIIDWHEKDIKKDEKIIKTIKESINRKTANLKKVAFLGSIEDYMPHIADIKEKIIFPKKFIGKSDKERGRKILPELIKNNGKIEWYSFEDIFGPKQTEQHIEISNYC